MPPIVFCGADRGIISLIFSVLRAAAGAYPAIGEVLLASG